jgi:hypothetical protein
MKILALNASLRQCAGTNFRLFDSLIAGMASLYKTIERDLVAGGRALFYEQANQHWEQLLKHRSGSAPVKNAYFGSNPTGQQPSASKARGAR